MKRIYTLFLILFLISFKKGISQCVSFGCAAARTGVTTDGSLPDLTASGGVPGTCFGTYKEVFWQFFLSTGGDFAQTYTPTVGSPAPGFDLDYVIFDIGTTPPASVNCPIDQTGWAEIECYSAGDYDLPVGPGVTTPVIATTPGHYYAIGIVVWQGMDNFGVASYTFDIGTPTLDAGGGPAPLTVLNCDASLVLPVKLSSFGAKVNNCVVNLNWKAENEVGFKKYEVEMSKDGRNFQTIATINPVNSGLDQTYAYQHNNPQQGKLYYRLKMIDVDGKFEYSKTIAMKLDCSQSSVFVYPNPVTDILNVNITNSQNNVRADLFDQNGKRMYTGKLISGTNLIDMTKFAKGIYLLTLKNNGETKNIKIIK